MTCLVVCFPMYHWCLKNLVMLVSHVLDTNTHQTLPEHALVIPCGISCSIYYLKTIDNFWTFHGHFRDKPGYFDVMLNVTEKFSVIFYGLQLLLGMSWKNLLLYLALCCYFCLSNFVLLILYYSFSAIYLFLSC